MTEQSNEHNIQKRTQQLKKQQTKELKKLWRKISTEEVCVAREAYDRGKKEEDPFDAYKLFGIAYCGLGTSDFSRNFTVLANKIMNKFCLKDELFTGEDWQIARKCLAFVKEATMNADMELLDEWHMFGVRCERYLFNAARSMSMFTKEKQAKIRLHKEAIFWLLFEVRKNWNIEGELYESSAELKDALDATE